MVINIVSFILFCVGIYYALGLNLEKISDDISNSINTKDSLSEKSLRAKGKLKTPKFYLGLIKIRTTLISLGKEKQFKIALAISLILLLDGSILGVIFDNMFLSPILSVALAIIPFWYLSHNLAIYDMQVKDEIETALSVITSSYILNNDIVEAVEENIKYIRPPVRDIFSSFLNEVKFISPDIKQAIRQLKEKIDDKTFIEYCDTLILCQDNSNLRFSLMSIVSKYTDLRVINSELESKMKANRKEFYLMVLIVLSNIPLLKILNEEWFNALVNTTIGKVVLGITALVIFITTLLCQKFTKPIEYGKGQR
ncbi:MAG: hypothetical protein MJ236_02440 [Clostridia bacterium]|nr:hypothetical protein [Clostridia bacterium]